MSSLKERIEWLERELPPNPPRFKIHEDLPFAILRYDPAEEWDMRREVRLLATRLGDPGNGRQLTLSRACPERSRPPSAQMKKPAKSLTYAGFEWS